MTEEAKYPPIWPPSRPEEKIKMEPYKSTKSPLQGGIGTIQSDNWHDVSFRNPALRKTPSGLWVRSSKITPEEEKEMCRALFMQAFEDGWESKRRMVVARLDRFGQVPQSQRGRPHLRDEDAE